MGFLGGSVIKNLPANVGDTGLNPESEKSLGEGIRQHTLVFLTEKSHGQGSLAGYSPWDHRESDN